MATPDYCDRLYLTITDRMMEVLNINPLYHYTFEKHKTPCRWSEIFYYFVLLWWCISYIM